MSQAGIQPDILHAHEWQTSALPMLYWEAYHPHALHRARMVLTIHCLDNPGECREDEFAATGTLMPVHAGQPDLPVGV